MNEIMSRIAVALNPIAGLLLVVTGGALVSLFTPSPVAIAIGAIAGLALAVPLCGSVGLLVSIDRHTQRIADETVAAVINGSAAATGQATSPLSQRVSTPVARAQGYAMSSTAKGSHPTSAPVAGSAGGAAPTDQGGPATAGESETDLLDRGEFALYHLSKAKRLLAAGNYREAAAQAAASLVHETTAEAKEIRRLARSKGAG